MKPEMAENEWLRLIAAQVRLGIVPAQVELEKLAKALPAMMEHIRDLEGRAALLEARAIYYHEKMGDLFGSDALAEHGPGETDDSDWVWTRFTKKRLKRHAGARIHGAEIWSLWRRWCKELCLYPGSRQYFTKKMERLFKSEGGFFVDVGFKDTPNHPQEDLDKDLDDNRPRYRAAPSIEGESES